MNNSRFTFTFRLMLAALVIAFGLVLYAQGHGPRLSSEAKQYTQLVWDTESGLSLAYGFQKICWLLGTVLGGAGIALLFLRIRVGLLLLVLCAPLLVIAAVLNAPPLAYPDIEQMTVILLECLTSAIWGSVVTCALLANKILFAKSEIDGSTSTPVSHASFWARFTT